MAKILEDIVRERVTMMAKGLENEHDRFFIPEQLEGAIAGLKEFNSTNTLATLKECVQILQNEQIIFQAVESYVSIAGVEAIPFINEAVEKGRLKGHNIYRLRIFLEGNEDEKGIIEALKKRKKFADAEKFTTFFKRIRNDEIARTAAVKFHSSSNIDKIISHAKWQAGDYRLAACVFEWRRSL